MLITEEFGLCPVNCWLKLMRLPVNDLRARERARARLKLFLILGIGVALTGYAFLQAAGSISLTKFVVDLVTPS